LKAYDKISEDYHDQVDELLENQTDHNLFNSLNQKELDEIWEEVSTEIEIGEVWNSISTDLDIVMPVISRPRIIVKSTAIALIFFIGLFTVKIALLNSGVERKDIVIENKQNIESPELMMKNKPGYSNTGEQVKGGLPVLRSSLDNSEDGSKAIPLNSNKNGLTQEAPIPLSNEVVSGVFDVSGMTDSNLFVSFYEIPGEKISFSPALCPIDPVKKVALSRMDLHSLKIHEDDPTLGYSSPVKDRRKISAGLTILFRNSWLLNHETMDGLKSETLNSTEIVFFPDAALCLNYALHKSWLLQAEGFLYSNTGQEYFEYIYGQYARKKITLNYSTIALSIKYKFTRRGHFLHRSSINLFAGGYLSVLHYADQKVNTDLEKIGSQYEKFDYGVRLGSEIELPLSDYFSLAPGLFLSLGIPNIYKGDGNIPGYLKRTQNGSAGFHLAFYYHFD
jgi:hypothetical protein